MNSCNELIEKEEKRYKGLLKYLNTASPVNSITGNLYYLLNLENNQYETTIDLENSIFSFTTYNLDKNLMIYDYQVHFKPVSSNNDFYRAIVITNKEVKLDRNKLAYIDERFKIDDTYPLLYIGIPLIAKGAVSNIFSDPEWTGSPFVVYCTTNIDLLKYSTDDLELNSFVEYHNQLGENVCTMNFGAYKKCSVISKDGFASEDYVAEWIKKNIDMQDDTTKLVEMAGYYHSSKRLEKLIRTLKLF